MNLVIKQGSGQQPQRLYIYPSQLLEDVQVVLDMEISTGIRAGTIGKKMDELVQERIRIIKGIPVFGTVLLDCDLIVYFIILP